MVLDTEKVIKSCFVHFEPLLKELAIKLHEGLQHSLREAIQELDSTSLLDPLGKVPKESLPAQTGLENSPLTSEDSIIAAIVPDLMTSLRLGASLIPLAQQAVATNIEVVSEPGKIDEPDTPQTCQEDSPRCADNMNTVPGSNSFNISSRSCENLDQGDLINLYPLRRSSRVSLSSASKLRPQRSVSLNAKAIQRISVALGREKSLPDYLPSVACISKCFELDMELRNDATDGPREHRLLQLEPQHKLHSVQRRVFTEVQWINVWFGTWLRPLHALMNKQACIETIESGELLLRTCHASRSIYNVLKAMGHCYYDFNNDPTAIGPVTTAKLLHILIWMLVLVIGGEVTQYKFVRNIEKERILREILARPVPTAWWNDWQLNTADLEALRIDSREHAHNHAQEYEDDFVFDPDAGSALHPDWLSRNAPLIVLGRELAIQLGLKDLADGKAISKLDTDRDMDKLQALEQRVLNYYISVLAGIVTTCRKDLESAQIYQTSALQFLSALCVCICYILKEFLIPE